MIAIGEHYCGPEHRNSRISDALNKASLVIVKSRPSDFRNGRPWVNPIFVVAGTLGGPAFDGIRIGNFNRKQCGLVVEIAIPQSVVDGKNLRDPVVKGLQMANAAAFHFFDGKGMKFALDEAEELVAHVNDELSDFV